MLRTPATVHRRRGTVAVLVALCLIGLFGVVAIALDGGMLLDRRRHVQATADAAALAAATQLYQRYPTLRGTDDGTARQAAFDYAAANGYPNDGVTANVTVNIPPQSGPFANQLGHVEVIIEYLQPRAFSAIWDSEDVPVRARAVARGMWEVSRNGIMVLDLTQKAALNAHGGGTIVVNGAPVIVNSNDPEAAAVANGTNVIITAPDFYIVGGYSTTGGAQFIGNIHTGERAAPDPLRYLPPPDPNTLPTRYKDTNVINHSGGLKQYILSPGRYVGGLSFSSKDSVIMEPGIYYMDGGGFSWSGQSGTSLTAEGVMIYNAPTGNSQKVSISGQGTVKLTAPTSGTYQGIAIFQDRNANVDVNITGNGAFDIRGTLYAANAFMKVAGNGDVSLGSQHISRMLDVGGNGGFTITWDPTLAPRVRIITLVE
jgi:hypothetical protein